MAVNAELSGPRSMWVSLVALLLVIATLTSLVIVVSLSFRADRLTDDRLIGNWQSDEEQTISDLREHRPVDERQERTLRKLFGTMRVTYTPTTYTTELHGTTVIDKYEVLGTDKHSVVIREVDRQPSELDALELSEFSVIQFDGPDSYWQHTRIGDMREFFKRVQ